MSMRNAAFVLLLLAFSLTPREPRASDPSDFYRGKIIRLIVGASAGRGYSEHARIVARHFSDHIPGKPTVVVENMPAGAGIAATNYLYNVATKDGLELGLFNRYTIIAPIVGLKRAMYKPEAFEWLGTTANYSNNAYVFIIRANLPVKTIGDLRHIQHPLNVGDAGATPVRVLREALGLNLNVISGYQGDALDLAFERGEIDGLTVGYLTMLSIKPHWITRHLARIMIQFGRDERLPALADVPTARELARTTADRELIAFAEAPIMLGYPFAAPPGTPPTRVAILRKAFDDTMADPAFQTEMRTANLEFSPQSGAAVSALVKQIVETPNEVVARYKAVQGVVTE